MDSNKRRKNAYYGNKNYKKKRDCVLELNFKGFMCTCNFREKDCVKEAYNILNEYADNLYSEEANPKEGSKETEDGAVGGEVEEEEEEDIDAALAKEVESLKQENNRKSTAYRFKAVESGTNNCVFIRTTLPDPVELAYHIVKDVDSTKKQKTRYLLRLIPIEATCKAKMDDIKATAGGLFDKYFSKEGKTFAIVFNRRNSSSLDRNTVIEELAEMIKFRNPSNSADLKHAQLTVIVEIIQWMCCLSVVPDYFKLHKYNLLEICCPKDKAATGDGGEKHPQQPEDESKSKTDLPSGESNSKLPDGSGDKASEENIEEQPPGSDT